MPQLDLPVLAAFAALWVFIVPVPGPNILMVSHVALTRSARHVALAILGNMAGIFLLSSLAFLGWAALLHAFPWLRLAVTILGGLYLIWFGWRLIERARDAPTTPIDPRETPADFGRTLVLGFVTALSNAQAIIFITSIYAVTGLLSANLATGLAASLIMIGMNASYLALIGWLFQREPVRRGYARFRRVIEGTIGLLFLALGGRMLLRLVWR
jgi:threonine/homoserine/homoserine lactone efflux protein